MARSKLDPNLIIQCEHDEALAAKKVRIIGTEMAIELNADDGDSVITQARCESMELTTDQEFDISKYYKAKMYCLTESDNTYSPVTLEVKLQ